eukprot:TRINITY_DN3619_c1_g1_i1.p1 TRINITY_DN3619_c1_g1~~TRINITY_DN3619_c1_g1_i1.p1  ORF type:complete len:1028 (+),score=217.36 TRINITY_DN3619_c1_g1_i1:280-3084(+)
MSYLAERGAHRLELWIRGCDRKQVKTQLVNLTESIQSLLQESVTTLKPFVSIPCSHCVYTSLASRQKDIYCFPSSSLHVILAGGGVYASCRSIIQLQIRDIAPDLAMENTKGELVAKLNYLEMTKIIDNNNSVLIGVGSYGRVWKSTWNGKLIAIKELSTRKPETEGQQGVPADATAATSDKNPVQVLSDFRREVNIMTLVTGHPNIVGLQAFCVAPRICLILDLLPLGNLYNFIHNVNNNDQNIITNILADRVQAVDILCDVAKAMKFLHAQEPAIIHRDLKSPNILLKFLYPNNNDSTPLRITAQISDFGYAQVLTLSSNLTDKPGDNPTWLAPELIKKEATGYNTSIDVYAFGVVCYEVLSRSTFLSDLHYYWLIEDAVLVGKRPDLSFSIAPGKGETLELEFQNLIQRSWHQNSSERPSFDSIVLQLESIRQKRVSRSLESKEEKLKFESNIRALNQILIKDDKAFIMVSKKGSGGGEGSSRIDSIADTTKSLNSNQPEVDEDPKTFYDEVSTTHIARRRRGDEHKPTLPTNLTSPPPSLSSSASGLRPRARESSTHLPSLSSSSTIKPNPTPSSPNWSWTSAPKKYVRKLAVVGGTFKNSLALQYTVSHLFVVPSITTSSRIWVISSLGLITIYSIDTDEPVAQMDAKTPILCTGVLESSLKGSKVFLSCDDGKILTLNEGAMKIKDKLFKLSKVTCMLVFSLFKPERNRSRPYLWCVHSKKPSSSTPSSSSSSNSSSTPTSSSSSPSSNAPFSLKIKVWNKSWKCKKKWVVDSSEEITTMMYHEGYVWIANGKEVLCFNARTFNMEGKLKTGGHKERITSMIAVGAEIWTGGEDKMIKIWCPKETGRCVKTLEGHEGTVVGMCTEGRIVWSCGVEKQLLMWDTKGRSFVKYSALVHKGAVKGVVVVRGEGGAVVVWSVAEKGEICIWK